MRTRLSTFSPIVSHSLPRYSAAPLRTVNPMDSVTSLAIDVPRRCQTVIVMRHGERLDNFDKSWLAEAARPWDPPLFEAGCERSFRTGLELRTQLGIPIHRIVVSPFLRCVETASEVARALCGLDKNSDAVSGADLPINLSMIKVSVEYGLCEMFNGVAIRTPPNDGEFGFNLSEIKQKLPAGTLDPEFEPVGQEVPRWGESNEDARARYERVIRVLADKYPFDNLLLITHGEGLRATVSTFSNGIRIHKVDYCAYAKLQRQMTLNDDSASEFAVISHHGYLLRNDDA